MSLRMQKRREEEAQLQCRWRPFQFCVCSNCYNIYNLTVFDTEHRFFLFEGSGTRNPGWTGPEISKPAQEKAVASGGDMYPMPFQEMSRAIICKFWSADLARFWPCCNRCFAQWHVIPTYSDPDPHSLLVDMSFSVLQSRTSTLAAENCRRWKKEHVWKSWRAASGGTSKSLLQSCQNRPRHF